MPRNGRDLGADLYDLWTAGRDNLPTLAQVFATANGAVADTDHGMAAAFRRPELFGGGRYGPAYAAWKELRDEVQTILGDTAENLRLTGEALCLAATEYAKTDQEAADELKLEKLQKGDPTPVTVPAPRYP